MKYYCDFLFSCILLLIFYNIVNYVATPTPPSTYKLEYYCDVHKLTYVGLNYVIKPTQPHSSFKLSLF